MKQSLIAFDTDRIKEYVFATDILKEIRGASNILDTLNRQDMPRCVGGTCYYAHGGSGLFVVPTDDATACINPTTTSLFDMKVTTRYAAPAYSRSQQEGTHVTSQSDRRGRLCHSHV